MSHYKVKRRLSSSRRWLLFKAIAGEFKVLVGIDYLYQKKAKAVEYQYCPCDECEHMTKFAAFGANRDSPIEPEGNPKRKWYKTIDGVRLIMELIGFGVLCFTARIYWQQMKANMGQANAAREQLTNQLVETRLDERAWIATEGFGLEEPYMVGYVGVYTHFKNSGKTPGIVTRLERIIESCDALRTNMVFDEIKTNEFIIAPSNESTGESHDFTVGVLEFMNLTNGLGELHFRWKIEYRDIFNNIHHTDFGCIVNGPKEDMAKGTIFRPCGPQVMD